MRRKKLHITVLEKLELIWSTVTLFNCYIKMKRNFQKSFLLIENKYSH